MIDRYCTASWFATLASLALITACERAEQQPAAEVVSASLEHAAEAPATDSARQASPDEHSGDEEGDEGAEESRTQLQLNDRYDVVRRGARLVLAYDSVAEAFVGTVENTTTRVLSRVRVKVHLSNGQELGPTPAGRLAPGERREIRLAAASRNFDGWTAHAEVREGEHGGNEESRPRPTNQGTPHK